MSSNGLPPGWLFAIALTLGGAPAAWTPLDPASVDVELTVHARETAIMGLEHPVVAAASVVIGGERVTLPRSLAGELTGQPVPLAAILALVAAEPAGRAPAYACLALGALLFAAGGYGAARRRG